MTQEENGELKKNFVPSLVFLDKNNVISLWLKLKTVQEMFKSGTTTTARSCDLSRSLSLGGHIQPRGSATFKVEVTK